MIPNNRKIRVLVVDDSSAMRQLLSTILRSDPDIEVIGTAQDPFAAREKIKALNPDVLTLDVEMPRMDGISFLAKLMRGHPMPVVMVSSLTQAGADATLQALDLGAVDFFAKPTLDTLTGVQNGAQEIIAKVKAASRAQIVRRETPVTERINIGSVRLTNCIVAIGASTGGTEAVRQILSSLPADFPGIVVVQHMPPGFTKSFAERLNTICEIQVKEAENGDRILPGHALIAPGDFHTEVRVSGAFAQVKVGKGERVNLFRPSVDVLFDSCAKSLGKNAIGVILTGMGSDGAAGLKRMRDAGAATIAQDEASSVVFGMPKEAIELGAADQIVSLTRIPKAILDLCSKAAA